MKMKRNFKEDFSIVMVMFIVTIAIGLVAIALEDAGMLTAKVRSIAIVISLCVLPFRKITAMLVPWLIEYLCSIDNALAQRIEPKWVTKSLDPSSDKTYLNGGITRLGQTAIWVFWLIIAALFSAIPVLARSRVDISLHNLAKFGSRIVQMFSGSPWILLYLILTVGFICILFRFLWGMYKNGIAILENKPENRRDLSGYPLFIAIYFIGKKIFNYFFFAYTAKMVVEDLIFYWVAILIIAVTLFLIWLHDQRNS